jgi:ethanolaminephosphotransferase
LFLYQTLDAIDGKQARRTGSSSPLGQLFDHGMYTLYLVQVKFSKYHTYCTGCDALCAIFNMVSAAASLQLGATLRSYIALSSVAISFYLAQWEEYHTGTMSCGNGYYGVTEGQLTLIALHFITAWQGNDFWKQSPLAPYINMSIVEALAVALVLSNIILAYTNITNVYNSSSSCSKKTSQQNSKEEIGHKTLSRSVAFLQLMPVFLNSVFGFVWITSKPNAQEYTQNPTFYLFVIGIGYVYFSVSSHQ